MSAQDGNSGRHAAIAAATAVLLLVVASMLGIFHWTVNRIYVPVGQSLQLQYKGPLVFGRKNSAKPGWWAEAGEIGVRRELLGPGRHFYCPIWYRRTRVPDIVIRPGEVGIVTCKLGDPLPSGEFLVDGDVGSTKFKGILRKALTPGRYRINPYGYEVTIVNTIDDSQGNQSKYSGWVAIPTGYVGVVTNLAENRERGEKMGIQDRVLQPGIYPINGNEKQVDVVEVGFRETTVSVEHQRNPDGTLKVDEAGEPLVAATNDGISFPSSDGFPINMDFTAIWGLMPSQAPHAIRTFGNVDQVENKVVIPQIESICRNNGSEFSAVQLLVGEDREKFQQGTLDEFRQILLEKQISLGYGLVRHIYIPKEVRQPIQTAFIADELTLTRQQEQKTAQAEAAFREGEKRVEFETSRVRADTGKQIAERMAEGDKTVGETTAETQRLVASVAKGTADLESQAKLVLGQAETDGKKLMQEALAQKFSLAVEAFGTPHAYNQWIFAQGLPDNVELKLLYAGEGTLWTDAKNLNILAETPRGSGANPPLPANK